MLFCRKGGFRFFSYYSTSEDSNDCVQEQAQKSWKESTKHNAKQLLITPVLVQQVCLPVSDISARKPEKYATKSDVSKYTTTSHDYTVESSSQNRSKSSKSSRFLQSSTSYAGDSTERKYSKSDHRLSSDETSARSKAPLTSEDQRSSHVSSTSHKIMSSSSSTSTKYKSQHSSDTRRSVSSMISKSDIKMSSLSSSGLTSHMSSEARPRSKLIYKSSWNPSLSFETPTKPIPNLNRAPSQQIKQSSIPHQGSNLSPQEITSQPWRRRKTSYQSRKQYHSLPQKEASLRPQEQTKSTPPSESHTPHIDKKLSSSHWQPKESIHKKKAYSAQTQKGPNKNKGSLTLPKKEPSRPSRLLNKQYSLRPPHVSTIGRIPTNDPGRKTPTELFSQEIQTPSQPTFEKLPEKPTVNFSQMTMKQPVFSHSEITSEELINSVLETPSSQAANNFVEILPKSKGMTPDSLSELLIDVPPDSTEYSVFPSEFSSEPLSDMPIVPVHKESAKHNEAVDTVTNKTKKCEVPTKQPYRSHSKSNSKPPTASVSEAHSPLKPPSKPPSKPSFIPPLNLFSRLCRKPPLKPCPKPSPNRCPKPIPKRCSKPPKKPPTKISSTPIIEPPSTPPTKPPPPPPTKQPSTPPSKPPLNPPPNPPAKPPPTPPQKPPTNPPPIPSPPPPTNPPLTPPTKPPPTPTPKPSPTLSAKPPPTPPTQPPPHPPPRPPSNPPPKPPSNPPPKPKQPSNPPPKQPPTPPAKPSSDPSSYLPPPPSNPPPNPPIHSPPLKNLPPQLPEEPPKRSVCPFHEKCPPCPPYQKRSPDSPYPSCPPCPPCPSCPPCPPCPPCPSRPPCQPCPTCSSYSPHPMPHTKPSSPEPSLKREDTKDSCMSELKDFCRKLKLLECFREKFKSEKMRECIRNQLIHSDGDRKLFQCEDYGESPCRRAHRHSMKEMDIMHQSSHCCDYGNLGCRPNSVRCPGCHSVVVTSVNYVVGLRTHLCALCLYLCGCCPCAILPYMVNFFKVPQHYCTQCGTLIGVQEVNFPF